MPDPLVAVDERVVLDEREPEGGGLVGEGRGEGAPLEGGPRLGQGRLEGAEVPEPGRPAGLGDDAPVQVERLGEREIAQRGSARVLREAAAQLAALGEHPVGGGLELGRARLQQVA